MLNEQFYFWTPRRFCEFWKFEIYIRHVNFWQHDILDRYDNVNVDVMYKPGWFKERNPLGKVPTIQVSQKTKIKNDIYENISWIHRLIMR